MTFLCLPANPQKKSKSFPELERRCRVSSAGVEVRASLFGQQPQEVHLSLTAPQKLNARPALKALLEALEESLQDLHLDWSHFVCGRVFWADGGKDLTLWERSDLCGKLRHVGALSSIGQAPLPGGRYSLWLYLIKDPSGPLQRQKHPGGVQIQRGALLHHWSMNGACRGEGNAYDQTLSILLHQEYALRSRGLTLAGNVVRTWFFLRDIEGDYGGLVDARRELFTRRGLTADTHYIASTGIAGIPPNPHTRVAMDAYSIGGLQPGQVGYLKALDYLSPTALYNVTFERGTTIDYRDRRHIYLSGTASIDKDGEIVHPGDVEKQLERTLVNMQALLAEAGATLDDMAHYVVYMRNPGDYAKIAPTLETRLGAAPRVVVEGAVCRPGWLVEIEGMGLVGGDDAIAPPY